MQYEQKTKQKDKLNESEKYDLTWIQELDGLIGKEANTNDPFGIGEFSESNGSRYDNYNPLTSTTYFPNPKHVVKCFNKITQPTNQFANVDTSQDKLFYSEGEKVANDKEFNNPIHSIVQDNLKEPGVEFPHEIDCVIVEDNNENKYLLNVDRLELTLKSSRSDVINDESDSFEIVDLIDSLLQPIVIHNKPYVETKSFMVKRSDLILRYYLHSFDVFWNGGLVGVLGIGFRKPTPKQIFTFRFNNRIFYDKPKWFISAFMNLMDKELGLCENNIKNLEIALDTNRDILSEVLHLILNTKKNPNCNNQLYSFTTGISCDILRDFSEVVVGSKKSGIVFAIYNSSTDKVNRKKEYVINQYKKSLDTKKHVYRIELRINDEGIKQLLKDGKAMIHTDSICDPNLLFEIFKTALGNKLCYKVLSSKYYDKNRHPKYKEIINFFDFENINSGYVLKAIIFNKNPKTSIVRNKKIRFKSMIDDYLMSNDELHFNQLKDYIRTEPIPEFTSIDYYSMIRRYIQKSNVEQINTNAIQNLESLSIDTIGVLLNPYKMK